MSYISFLFLGFLQLDDLSAQPIYFNFTNQTYYKSFIKPEINAFEFVPFVNPSLYPNFTPYPPSPQYTFDLFYESFSPDNHLIYKSNNPINHRYYVIFNHSTSSYLFCPIKS